MSLHVECGQAGGGFVRGGDAPLEIGNALAWSETIAAAGTSSNSVPSGGSFILTLIAEVEMWVAIGPTPNASANPRRRMPAGSGRSFVARSGDKVAWSAT